MHITNINRCLNKAKLDTIADFIWVKSKDIIITTNKAAFVSDISIIEKYLKENSNINSDYINSSCLLKFKSYLKILDLLYIVEKTNLSQIRYSLVVILGLNSVSGVQYKDMMIDRW